MKGRGILVFLFQLSSGAARRDAHLPKTFALVTYGICANGEWHDWSVRILGCGLRPYFNAEAL